MECAPPSDQKANAPYLEGPAPVLRTLIVDDDASILRTLATCLEALGCDVKQARTGGEALRCVGQDAIDLVFCDLKLARESGLDLVPKLVAERPGIDVVVITAYAAVETAVEAMRRGARDYVPKPFTPAQVRAYVERARERRIAEQRVTGGLAGLDEVAALLETASPRMTRALEVVTRAAPHDVPVLLRGEKGTGVGVVARRIHARSSRRDRPFLEVNCATAGSDELSSALLRRPSSAAVPEVASAGVSAEGGTLFLREVVELPPVLQERALQVLQEGRFARPGHAQRERSQPRLIASTSREDLDHEVRAGRFREELRYALSVVEVTLPALRERPEDLLPLSLALLAHAAARSGRQPPELSRNARARLVSYPWPGNLPELRNAVERALILTPGPVIGPECFPETVASATAHPVIGGITAPRRSSASTCAA